MAHATGSLSDSDNDSLVDEEELMYTDDGYLWEELELHDSSSDEGELSC